MTVKVHVSASREAGATIGWANGRTLTLDRCAAVGEAATGFNGRELLCLAVGGCYIDHLFLAADKRGVGIRSVRVDVEAECGRGPSRLRNVTLSLRVESDAGEAVLMDLAEHTDRIAGIPNVLRLGTSVRVTSIRVVAGAPSNDPAGSMGIQ
jgi:uncharacterized OsmC-like protein